MKLRFESVWLFVISVVISERFVGAAETLTELDAAIALQNDTELVYPLLFGARHKGARRINQPPRRKATPAQRPQIQDAILNAPDPIGQRIELTCDGAVSKFCIL